MRVTFIMGDKGIHFSDFLCSILGYMKYLRISEPFMWAFLLVGALAGATMIGWQVQTDWNNLPIAEQQAVLDSGQVEALADTFVREHFSLDTTSFQIVSTLTTTALPDTFLAKSYLSEEERVAYRDSYLSAVSVYFVRFFKAEQIEEYSVTIDAFRGEIVDFTQTLPEDVLIPSISADDAIVAARQFVAREVATSPDNLIVHTKKEETFPGGIERHIVFSWKGSEVDSEYGKGFVTFNTVVRGTSVSAFSPSFEYPEPYERALDKSSNIGMLVGFGSLLAWVLIIIAALVFMIQSFSAHKAVWKMSLGVTIVLGILSILDFVNLYPETLVWYSTIDSMTVYWIFAAFASAFGIILLSLMFFVPSVAGNTLAVEKYQDRIAPLMSAPRTPETKTLYRLALVRGYLLGIFFLGFTFALYWIGEEYFGVWYPYGEAMLPGGLSSFVPAFTLMLSLGLTAAITEEITFRLFGILWISKLTRSTALGVLIATLVWAFAHTDGSVLPVWFRGVEVLVGGLLFAYFFIRYNILTTIVAHYVHNIIIVGMLLFFTFGTQQAIPVILIFAAPGIAYICFEWAVSKKVKLTEV